MKIVYLNRKFDKNEISIEKVFSKIKEVINNKKIDYVEIENPYRNGILNLFKTIFYYRSITNKNDIVHITGQIHYAAIGLKTKKIIITVHDLGLYRNLSKLRLYFFKLFWIYLPFKKAKFIVAISEKTKEEIVNIMPSVKNKVIVIPNFVTIGIDYKNIDKPKNNKILIVGTRSNKNLVRSIEALEGLDIELVIIGILDYELRNKLNNFNINYKNYYNVSESELKMFYKESNILLFASIYEGFGLPILEGQASNCIVVTSNIVPMSEVAGEYSILVDPYSIESIREGVIKAINLTFDERLQMIMYAKENLSKYQLENVCNQYIDLYEKLNK